MDAPFATNTGVSAPPEICTNNRLPMGARIFRSKAPVFVAVFAFASVRYIGGLSVYCGGEIQASSATGRTDSLKDIFSSAALARRAPNSCRAGMTVTTKATKRIMRNE